MATASEMSEMIKEILLKIPKEKSQIKFTPESSQVYDKLKQEIDALPPGSVVEIPDDF